MRWVALLLALNPIWLWKRFPWFKALVFFVILGLFAYSILFSTAGCAHVKKLFDESAPKSTTVEWRKTLKMKVNGIKYYGVGLVPYSEKYEIKIYPPNKTIDLLQWSSCDGSDFAPDAVKDYFWVWKKDDEFFKITDKNSPFFTLSDIQKSYVNCPLRIDALTKYKKGLYFGILLFYKKTSKPQGLTVTVNCNRQKDRFDKGIAYCQASKGKVTWIEFSRPVVFTDDAVGERCPKLKRLSDRKIELYMGSGDCYYNFMDENEQEIDFYHYGFEENPPPMEVKE